MSTAFTLILLVTILATMTPSASAQKLFFFNYVYSTYSDANCENQEVGDVILKDQCESSDTMTAYFDEDFLTGLSPDWPQNIKFFACPGNCTTCIGRNVTGDTCEDLGQGKSHQIALVLNLYFYLLIAIIVVLAIVGVLSVLRCT
eukprot:TRINITY_DN4150_c0_g1_i1.p1 TRINITY_DN4150_c0_g1~~TRINITY_DN4150_c0_g1_i1.p1  ORF type:complete len:145 (-),score=22.71 TRINITY_DN4150_c0_g1_i1:71-505(-)